MQSIKLICCSLLLTFGCSCTNYLYQGQLSAKDSAGNDRNFILYWTRYEPLCGEIKAGPAMLLTECSPARPDFKDDPQQGIVYYGSSGFDIPIGQSQTESGSFVCGKILNYGSLKDIKTGPVSVRIDCQAAEDEFTLPMRNYLAARVEPYTFPIVQQIKKWSFFGTTLPAPQAPDCRGVR